MVAARLALACAVMVAGCGGGTDLSPTTDPDAIKREQERLGGQVPGGNKKAAKDDPVRREQERLRGQP